MVSEVGWATCGLFVYLLVWREKWRDCLCGKSIHILAYSDEIRSSECNWCLMQVFFEASTMPKPASHPWKGGVRVHPCICKVPWFIYLWYLCRLPSSMILWALCERQIIKYNIKNPSRKTVIVAWKTTSTSWVMATSFPSTLFYSLSFTGNITEFLLSISFLKKVKCNR